MGFLKSAPYDADDALILGLALKSLAKERSLEQTSFFDLCANNVLSFLLTAEDMWLAAAAMNMMVNKMNMPFHMKRHQAFARFSDQFGAVLYNTPDTGPGSWRDHCRQIFGDLCTPNGNYIGEPEFTERMLKRISR